MGGGFYSIRAAQNLGRVRDLSDAHQSRQTKRAGNLPSFTSEMRTVQAFAGCCASGNTNLPHFSAVVNVHFSKHSFFQSYRWATWTDPFRALPSRAVRADLCLAM